MLRPRPRYRVPLQDPRAEQVLQFAEAEESAGHRDYRDRAELRFEIQGHLNMRAMPERVACEVLGLSQGSLSDGSLSTDLLRAALQHLRVQPL